jgi:hypothetical protein
MIFPCLYGILALLQFWPTLYNFLRRAGSDSTQEKILIKYRGAWVLNGMCDAVLLGAVWQYVGSWQLFELFGLIFVAIMTNEISYIYQKGMPVTIFMNELMTFLVPGWYVYTAIAINSHFEVLEIIWIFAALGCYIVFNVVEAATQDKSLKGGVLSNYSELVTNNNTMQDLEIEENGSVFNFFCFRWHGLWAFGFYFIMMAGSLVTLLVDYSDECKLNDCHFWGIVQVEYGTVVKSITSLRLPLYGALLTGTVGVMFTAFYVPKMEFAKWFVQNKAGTSGLQICQATCVAIFHVICLNSVGVIDMSELAVLFSLEYLIIFIIQTVSNTTGAGNGEIPHPTEMSTTWLVEGILGMLVSGGVYVANYIDLDNHYENMTWRWVLAVIWLMLHLFIFWTALGLKLPFGPTRNDRPGRIQSMNVFVSFALLVGFFCANFASMFTYEEADSLDGAY